MLELRRGRYGWVPTHPSVLLKVKYLYNKVYIEAWLGIYIKDRSPDSVVQMELIFKNSRTQPF